MSTSVTSEEAILISVYAAALFLLFRKFSDFDWRLLLLASATIGLGTGVFIWPWAYIIFGWPGASLGAMASSALGLNTNGLILAGALLSAAVAMSIVALGVALLLILPIVVWKNRQQI